MVSTSTPTSLANFCTSSGAFRRALNLRCSPPKDLSSENPLRAISKEPFSEIVSRPMERVFPVIRLISAEAWAASLYCARSKSSQVRRHSTSCQGKKHGRQG